MKKPKPPYNMGTKIRGALRSVWRMHPTLQIVLRRDRTERPFVKKDGSISSKPRVFFTCYVCKEAYPRKGVNIDHIDPIGPTPGSKYAPPELTWDAFIKRMFCAPENLACICEGCHKSKTQRERDKRAEEYQSAS